MKKKLKFPKIESLNEVDSSSNQTITRTFIQNGGYDSITFTLRHPESLTGLIKRKTHVVRVSVRELLEINQTYIEAVFSVVNGQVSDFEHLFIPIGVIAVYRECKA